MPFRTIAWLAALALTCAPIPSLAATTVRTINGIEIITSQADAATPAAPRAGSRPQARTAPRAAAAHPAVAAPPAVAESALRGASALLRNALAFLGTRYVWGGASPGGFDCSGFTYYAYATIGVRIPRTADVQFAAGRPVAGDPLPGDLVFFQTYDYGASHVGIYLGGGRFVNSIGPDVHVASFDSPYFRSRYIGARRFLST